VLRPVLAARDQQLGARRRDGGDLGVVRGQVRQRLDRLAGLAQAAAEEVRRDHHDRNARRDALVQARQQEALRAPTRRAGHADPIRIDAVEPLEQIDGANARQRLQGQRVRVVVRCLRRLAPADHVDRQDDGSHAGKGCAAKLHVAAEAALGILRRRAEVAVRAEDRRAGARSPVRRVEVAGHVEARERLESDVPDGVPVVDPRRAGGRRRRRRERERIEPHRAEHVLADRGATRSPAFHVGPPGAERLEVARGLCLVDADTARRGLVARTGRESEQHDREEVPHDPVVRGVLRIRGWRQPVDLVEDRPP
jgi:hypothetical protein